MMDAQHNRELPFVHTHGILQVSSVEEGIYQNTHGMPFKTAAEFERHYYMLGDTVMTSMWTLVDDLDTALEVAARLDE